MVSPSVYRKSSETDAKETASTWKQFFSGQNDRLEVTIARIVRLALIRSRLYFWAKLPFSAVKYFLFFFFIQITRRI